MTDRQIAAVREITEDLRRAATLSDDERRVEYGTHGIGLLLDALRALFAVYDPR